MVAPSVIAPHVKEGTLRALAITGSRRSPELPDVPTQDEAGVSDWGAGFWGGWYDKGASAPAVRRRAYRPYTRRRTTTYVEDEPPPGP